MKTVLLIDDEPEMGTLVQACLRALEAEVEQVGTAEEAILSAQSHRPRVVLLDFNLKDDVKGVDILPLLREASPLKGVPIVAFTVHGSRRREAMIRGFDGFVGKPFSLPALRSAVEGYLAS